MPKETSKPSVQNTKSKTNFLDLRDHNHHQWKKIGIATACIIIVIAGLTGIIRYRAESERKSSADDPINGGPSITTPPENEVKIPSELDGMEVATSLATQPPLAIMIENHPDARPQSGLSLASVVYETVTEGGITRFLAIFGPRGGDTIGPVRSARPYFLPWVLEYDAPYAHVGGSQLALQQIKQLDIKDLDQFAVGAKAYRREPKKGVALEHTMYSDTSKLRQVAIDKFGSERNWTKPKFKTPIEKEQRPANQAISIDFSSASYNTQWNYDPETNTYLRSMAGKLHKDAATNETIRAANIIVQEVTRESVDSMKTVGNGKALIFQDGKRIEATWKKEKTTAPTKFFDPEGTEIHWNPGQRWFAVIPSLNSVSVK